MKKQAFYFNIAALLLAATNTTYASPTVYMPLGSGNQVIAADAATDEIKAYYSDVINSHGLVAAPDGEYLIAGSQQEDPLKLGQPKDTPNSKLFLIHPDHGHVMSAIPITGWSHHQAITSDSTYVLSTHGDYCRRLACEVWLWCPTPSPSSEAAPLCTGRGI